MRNKWKFLLGSSIVVAALILSHKEIRSIIQVSAGSVAQKSDGEVKSSSTPPNPKPVVSVPVDKLDSSKSILQNKRFNYLSVEGNRQNVMKRALQLNNGQYRNACVYFVAEALRQNGVDIPVSTCNTAGLIAQFKNRGWTRSSDYKKLLPGDICFSMDNNNAIGVPAHTYVFMAWASPDNYDYAMVCDNQADRYGTIYHKRNIVKIEVYKGEEKEPFQFFMREQ